VTTDEDEGRVVIRLSVIETGNLAALIVKGRQ
jgi:hypothetical protein